MQGDVHEEFHLIMTILTKPLPKSEILLKNICTRAKDSSVGEESILYAPSERLETVKKQVLSKFPDQIISFKWFHEEEYTLIMVQIREVACQIPVSLSIREIVNAVIGHPDSSDYIVAITVSAIESVEAADGLFKLAYHGGGSHSFFLYYYAPERKPSDPFKVPIYYRKMFDATRTIHVNSSTQLWERLFPPTREVYAAQCGVTSFSKDVLASDLRNFLLEHLDFIQHIAKATRNSLQIIEPAVKQMGPRVAQSLTLGYGGQTPTEITGYF